MFFSLDRKPKIQTTYMDNIEDCIEDNIEIQDYLWIDNFNKREKEYNKYYKNKQKKIIVYFLFIDKTDTVEYFLAKKIPLDNGILSRDKLVSLINNHKNRKKHIFYKLLKYNVTIDPENIDKLVQQKIDNSEFLTEEKSIQDIIVKDTIEMLQSTNAIFLIYKEKKPINCISNKTRRHHKKNISKTRKMPTNSKNT